MSILRINNYYRIMENDADSISDDTILKTGEIAIYFDATTDKKFVPIKIGNGTKAVKDLPFAGGLDYKFEIDVSILKLVADGKEVSAIELPIVKDNDNNRYELTGNLNITGDLYIKCNKIASAYDGTKFW